MPATSAAQYQGRPFEWDRPGVGLYDDGSLRTVSSLDPGKETNVEFNRVELKKGQRQLTAAVDPHKLIAESSEDNNELKISVRCKDEGDDDD